MISIDETNYTTVLDHLKQGTRFRVLGYRTQSDEVWDYDLIYLGKDGYKGMVRESLETLQKLKKEMPQLFQGTVAFQAAKELEESFQATLNGTQKERNWTVNPDDNAKRLFSMRIVKASCVAGATSPSTRKSSEKTIKKNEIRKLLPINDYLGQLALTPGKFRVVEIEE